MKSTSLNFSFIVFTSSFNTSISLGTNSTEILVIKSLPRLTSLHYSLLL